MGGLVMAWLVGETIIVYRSVKRHHAPPGPGQLLLSSGVFVLLALMAEIQPARTAATMLAWGFNIAAFTNIAQLGTPKGSESQWPPGSAPDNRVFPEGSTVAKASSGAGGKATAD